MTPDEQIALWVAGDSRCPNDQNECCPDFSCCNPKLLMPLAERQRFQQATQAEREPMLMGALSALVEGTEGVAFVTRATPHAPCNECGKTRELRPYGAPGKPDICLPCFEANPEHEARLKKGLSS